MSLVDIKDRAPCEPTVRLLEGLLRQAKEGEIRSLVYAVSWDDDSVSSGWSTDRRGNIRRLIGEMAVLQHEFLTNTALGEEDSVLAHALCAD